MTVELSADDLQLIEHAKILVETTNIEIFYEQVFEISKLSGQKMQNISPEDLAQRLERILPSFKEGCNALRRRYARFTRKWKRGDHGATLRLNSLDDRQLMQAFTLKDPVIGSVFVAFIVQIGTVYSRADEDQKPQFEELLLPFVKEAVRYYALLKQGPITRFNEEQEWHRDFSQNVKLYARMSEFANPDHPMYTGNDDVKQFAIDHFTAMASVSVMAYSGVHAQFAKKIYQE